MTGAEFMWGVSAPLGKVLLAGGISPLLLTECRTIGAAGLFWGLSLCLKPEHVAPKDLLMMFLLRCWVWFSTRACFFSASAIHRR